MLIYFALFHAVQVCFPQSLSSSRREDVDAKLKALKQTIHTLSAPSRELPQTLKRRKGGF